MFQLCIVVRPTTFNLLLSRCALDGEGDSYLLDDSE